MICMRNVRIFRIKRGRFLKFSKTKENCLASNKYIPKNYLFPPSVSNSNLSSNIDESKIEKKKKRISKNVSSNLSSRIHERAVAWFNLKNKKKEKKRKEKKKTFVSLPRKKQTQSSGFETVGIRQGSDITRVEITRGERRSGATKVPRFSSSFFSFGGGALKRSRGGISRRKLRREWWL